MAPRARRSRHVLVLVSRRGSLHAPVRIRNGLFVIGLKPLVGADNNNRKGRILHQFGRAAWREWGWIDRP